MTKEMGQFDNGGIIPLFIMIRRSPNATAWCMEWVTIMVVKLYSLNVRNGHRVTEGSEIGRGMNAVGKG